MFGFLSAEDLALSAQACRYLADVSSQDELWKRLYFARYYLNVALFGIEHVGVQVKHFTKHRGNVSLCFIIADFCIHQPMQC